MMDEQDIKDWERLPLTSQVITSPYMGAWLYYRDQRRDKQRDKQIRAAIFNEIMPILIEIVDKEGSCYGYEQEIDRLECEWEQLKDL